MKEVGWKIYQSIMYAFIFGGFLFMIIGGIYHFNIPSILGIIIVIIGIFMFLNVGGIVS